jgi:hypothetical protein
MANDNKFISQFFNLTSECGFPGCEELRKQYLSELRVKIDGCAACRRMALVRKYKSIINNRLKRTNHE